MLLVVAAGLLGAAAPAHALTRQQANAIALKILRPERFENAVLYGLPRPLPQHSFVFDNTPVKRSGSGDVVVGPTDYFYAAERRAWYFWLDRDNGANFPHANSVLVLDATTGSVLYLHKTDGSPLISNLTGHGEPPPFLANRGAETNRKYVLYSSHPFALPQRPVAPTGESVLPLGFMRDDCLVTIGDRQVVWDFTGDFDDFEQWAAHAGVRNFAMPPNSTGTDLIQRVHELTTMAKDPCRNILIVLAGHGSPPPGYSDPNAVTSVLPAVETGVDFSDDPNDPTKAIDGSYIYVQGPDLRKLIEDNPQTGFEIVVDSCFSGRFTSYLMPWAAEHKLTNLQLVATSANDTEVSWVHVPAGYVGQPGTTPVPKQPGQPIQPKMGDGIAKNPASPRQIPAETDYVHAFVDSLYNWTDTNAGFLGQDGPIAFVPALQRAARDAQSNDFVAGTLLWTHPTASQAAEPFIVSYHYRVHISVSGATANWQGPDADGNQIAGSTQSSWDLDTPDVTITVDYTNRTAANPTPPSGEAPRYAVTGTASGTISTQPKGGSPQTCSWSLDKTVTNRAVLTMVGNDSKPPILEYGFQNTRELGIAVDLAGFAQVAESCPPTPAPFPSAQAFLGTANSYCTPLIGFTIPIWDLGKDVIQPAPSPFPGNTASCSLFYGKPVPKGNTATVSGNYNVTLTQLPSKH